MPVKIYGAEEIHPDYRAALAKKIGDGGHFDHNGMARASGPSGSAVVRIRALHVSTSELDFDISAYPINLTTEQGSVCVFVWAETTGGEFFDLLDCSEIAQAEEHEVGLVQMADGGLWAFRCDDQDFDDVFCMMSVAHGDYLPFKSTHSGDLLNMSLGFTMEVGEVYFGTVIMSSGPEPVILSGVNMALAIEDQPKFTFQRRRLRRACAESIAAAAQAKDLLSGIMSKSTLDISQCYAHEKEL